MEQPLRTSELAAKAGISKSYASEILAGKRTPSLSLAIAIFRRTGRKFGQISGASEAQISAVEGLSTPQAEAA